MIATDKQLQELLTYCIDFARLMLEGAGEFYPFGAVVDRSGALKAVGGYDGTERPKPHEIYRMLADSFASEACSGNILAAALAANVDIPSDYSPAHPDGLRVHLESSAFSRYIYVPYSVAQQSLFRKHRTVQFAEPIPVQVQPDFFAGSAGA